MDIVLLLVLVLFSYFVMTTDFFSSLVDKEKHFVSTVRRKDATVAFLTDCCSWWNVALSLEVKAHEELKFPLCGFDLFV